MALTNQATITLAVNIRNLAKVESLTKAFNDLRSTIITMQRSTQGVSGMARAIKAASEEAVRLSRSQDKVKQSSKEVALEAKRAGQAYSVALKNQKKAQEDANASTREAARWSEQFDAALRDSTGHSRAFTAELKKQDRATDALNASNKQLQAQRQSNAESRELMSAVEWNRKFTQVIRERAAEEVRQARIVTKAIAEQKARVAQEERAAAKAAREKRAEEARYEKAWLAGKRAYNAEMARQEKARLNAWREYNAEMARRAKIDRDVAKAIDRNNKALAQERQRLAAVNIAIAKRLALEDALKRKRADDLKSLSGRLKLYEEQLDAVFRSGFRLQMIGQDLRFLGQRIFDFIGGVMDTFGKFEFMAGRAAGALGAWTATTDAGFRALQESVLDSAESLRLFTAEDVAKSLYFLGSTTGQVVKNTKDLHDVMMSLEPIMKTAALTETSYETAIKGTYSILVQYNNELVTAAQATGDYTAMTARMNDISVKLFYVTQKTAAEFEDLIQSFKMVGPVAANAGASFEDIVDLLGRLADVGIRGSMSGRALRQMFIQMVKPSLQAKTALQDLFRTAGKTIAQFKGKSYTEIMFPKGAFVGTTEYIKNLALATENLTYQERASVLARISTANELPVLTALVAQQTAALNNQSISLSKVSGNWQDAQKTFDDAWARLSESWIGVTGAVERGIESLKISVGRSFAEAFTPFMHTVTEVIKKIRAWVEANPELVATIGKVAAAAGALLIAFGGLASLAGGLIALAAGMTLVVRAFKPLFGAIGGFAVLVTAIVDSVIRNFDELQAGLMDVQDAFSTLIDSLSSGASQGGDALSAIYGPFKAIADFMVGRFADILPVLADFIRMISGMKELIPILDILTKSLGVLFAYRMIGTITGFIGKMRSAKNEINATALAARSSRVDFSIMGTGFTRVAPKVTAFAGSVKRAAASTVTSLKSMGAAAAGFAAGPWGLLIAGVGLAAYENNWGGFRDGIEMVTRAFRDFNAEIKDLASSFGTADNLSARLETSVKRFAQMAAPSTGPDIFSGFAVLNLLIGKPGEAKAFLEAKKSTDTQAYTVLMLEWIRDVAGQVSINVANDLNARAVTQEDAGRVWDTLVNSIVNTGNAVGFTEGLEKATISILELIARGGTKQQFTELYKQLDATYTEFGTGAGQMSLEAFMRAFYSSLEESRASLATSQRTAEAVYRPILESIKSMMATGASVEAVGAALVRPLATVIGGAVVNVGPGLAEALDKFSPEFREEVMNLITARYGPNAISEMLGEETSNSLYATLTTQVKSQLDRMYENFFGSFQTAAYDAIDKFGKADQSTRYLQDKAIRAFLDTAMPDGKTILQAAESGKIEGELADAIKSVVASATTLGIVQAADVSSIPDAAGRTYDEIIQSIASVWNGRGSVIKNIRKLLRGKSDSQNARELIAQMTGLSIRRGGRSSAPLAAQQLADQFLDDGASALEDSFTQGGRRLKRSIARGLRGIKWGKLSGDQKESMFNLIELINPSLKNPIVIPERIKRQMRGNLLSAVSGALTPEQVRGMAEGDDIGSKGGAAVASLLDKIVSPQMTLSAQTLSDATAQGVKVGENVATGMSTGYSSVIEENLVTKVKATKTSIEQMSWIYTGEVAGEEVATGFRDGFNMHKEVAHRSVVNLKNGLRNISWNHGGQQAGKSWAYGFNFGIRQTVLKTFSYVADVAIGNSPPKAGPLKNIDKGGANIGKAWGGAWRKSAVAEVHRGVRDAQIEMQGRRSGMNTEITRNDKRQISITLDVKSSDGSVDRAQTTEIRKGLLDALVIADLEHMVTVR